MNAAMQKCLPVVDWLLVPLVWLAAQLFRAVRSVGIRHLPWSRATLLRVGIYPLRDHYYEPKFDHRRPLRPYSADRALPGIDWNLDGQLRWLQQFRHAHELESLPDAPTDDAPFHFENHAFMPGDAEVWYQLIRSSKPRRIIEIGSGHSTRLAILAVKRNLAEDPSYRCSHVCVEPYEMPWLEKHSAIEVVRQRVEELSTGFFSELSSGDILFIDSSHVIRPQGDVLFEYLELLPTLSAGVLVHVHDIFSPRDYPEAWLVDRIKFWNEQYLLEAFISGNRSWRIEGALNHLRHHHFDALKSVAPRLDARHEPGSFYLRKVD